MADAPITEYYGPAASADFGIRLEFEPDSRRPARIFEAMRGLIEAFEIVDNDLAASVSVRVRPELLLGRVEAGSLTARLKYAIESIDDRALESGDFKRIVGSYLVKGKRKLLEYLEHRETVREAGEIYGLGGMLGEAAEEAGLTLFSLTSPVSAPRVAENLRLLSEATTPLSPGDKAHLLTEEGSVPINTRFRLDRETIERLLTHDTASEMVEMTLVVKKPDFLGNSMWDFRHEGKGIVAKVVDAAWLGSFRGRAVALRPGDALRALVEIETMYGRDREIVATRHKVVKVYEVIPRGG